jgi:hypothetical protein
MNIYWSVFLNKVQESEHCGKWASVALVYNEDQSGAIIISDHNDISFSDTEAEAIQLVTEIQKPLYHKCWTNYKLVYVDPTSELFSDLYDKWYLMNNVLLQFCEMAIQYHSRNWFVRKYIDIRQKIKGWISPTP